MRSIEDLTQLIADVAAAPTPKVVWPVLKTFVEQFGVTHLSMFATATDNVLGERLFSDGGIDFGDGHPSAPNPLNRHT